MEAVSYTHLIVDKTSPVRHLHFEEAAELAYFGAKILHPTCVQPAKYANIPVRLLNTMEPTEMCIRDRR